MIAFVSGGTGFIGSHLVDALLADAEVKELRCLVRRDLKWLAGKPITPVKGDLFDIVALREHLKGVDVLYHLAALVKAPNKETFHRANVEATENLIRLALRSGVKKIIILSSLAAVGPSNGSPLTEESPLKPISMYGESKKQMEAMIHKLADEHSSITIIRPPAVFGQREEHILSFFKSASKGLCPIVGNGKEPKISFVHVSDVVHGMRLAEQHTKPGVDTFFISSEELYTWNEIMSVTGKVLNKKVKPLYIKPALVKQVAGVVESVASFFGQYPMLNRDKANELVHEWTCSVDKARRELGFSQLTSLEAGLYQTIHWYQRHYWI